MHDEENLWPETDHAEASATSSYSAPPRYSQPLASSPPPPNPPVVRAGFMNGEPGFIFRGEDGEVKRVLADKSNIANERPVGFMRSLARLFGGQR